VKVLVVSDNHLLRSGLRSILLPQTRLRIVNEIGFDSISETTLTQRADLVLFDLDPKGNEVLGAIVHVQMALKDSRILLLTDLADHEFARKALAVGAHGIVLKIQPPAVLIAAIEDLCPHPHTESVLQPSETKGIKKLSKADTSSAESIRKINRLTSREREIIRLVGLGLKNKDIATRLSITDITVRHHLTSIFRKLEVSDRQKLLILAHRYGLADLALGAEPP
jgi:DNA-binding NarL/FixJ family response regulator